MKAWSLGCIITKAATFVYVYVCVYAHAHGNNTMAQWQKREARSYKGNVHVHSTSTTTRTATTVTARGHWSSREGKTTQKQKQTLMLYRERYSTNIFISDCGFVVSKVRESFISKILRLEDNFKNK